MTPPDVCPNCGAEVPRNAKACPECGAMVNSSYAAGGQVRSGKAIASMVCGIVALPACMFYGIPSLVLGIVAWVLGVQARREVREGTTHPSSASMAKAGIICGAIAAGLSLLGMLGLAAFIVYTIKHHP